ncbi:MAG: TonB-dependent receptor [Bacteroidota bacterium]
MPKLILLCLLAILIGYPVRAQSDSTAQVKSELVTRLPPPLLPTLELVIEPFTQASRLLDQNREHPTIGDEQGPLGLYLQPVNATLNAQILRIRGLPGRHTQFVRDGFPVFGGLAASFDRNQFPLSPVYDFALVKGPSSTLFGNGAIGGIVQLNRGSISPGLTQAEVSVNSIGPQQIGFYTAHRLSDHINFSTYAGLQLQGQYDADKDGFSDLPRSILAHLNPRFEIALPQARSQLVLDLLVTRDNRRGGDLVAVQRNPATPTNFYFEEMQSTRVTTQAAWTYRLRGPDLWLAVRNSFNLFDRDHVTQEFWGSPTRGFGGQQTNSFSEVSLQKRSQKSKWKAGAHVTTESFVEDSQSAVNQRRDQSYLTAGLFGLLLYRMDARLNVEAGLRLDYIDASSKISGNDGRLIPAPRLMALFKASPKLRFRLGGGFGYRMPSIFDEVAEPYGFRSVVPIDFAGVVPEQSRGGEFSVEFGRTDLQRRFSLLQRAFYTQVNDPLVWQPLGGASAEFVNFAAQLISVGLETKGYLRLGSVRLEGVYIFNNVYWQDTLIRNEFLQTPLHNVHGTAKYKQKRFEVEASGSWHSSQLLPGNLRQDGFAVLNAGVKIKISPKIDGWLRVNNLLDTRQSRFASLLSAPYNTPQFTPLWAPLVGRNFSARLVIRI